MIIIPSKNITQIYKTGEKARGHFNVVGRRPLAFAVYQGRFGDFKVRTVLRNKWNAYIIKVETNGRGYKGVKIR